jgi:hypothetical protein
MSSESVCQFACSWVNVGSFYMPSFGVVYMTCGDFHDGSKVGKASVRRTLRKVLDTTKYLDTYKCSCYQCQVSYAYDMIFTM